MDTNTMDTQKVQFIMAAMIAVAGSSSYHFFVKKTPDSIHPVMSIALVYVFALLFSGLYLLIYSNQIDWTVQFKQVGWLQFCIAISVFLIELGFLLMYRYGWSLSAGNVVVGACVNMLLLLFGVIFLKENLSAVNICGVGLCISGVTLMTIQ